MEDQKSNRVGHGYIGNQVAMRQAAVGGLAGSPGGGASGSRNSPVQRELDAASEAVADLVSNAAVLEKRIGPVLGPVREHDAPEEDPTAPPVSPQCEVAESARSLASTVRRCNRQLQDIIERLEV